jgi:hypothetical protein
MNLQGRAVTGVTAIATLFLGMATTRALAQAPEAPARANKSVYGKLQSIDKQLNGIVMKTDAGKRMAWQFDAKVIAELGQFKPGDPIIVIYRQLAGNAKRVTAVAFPGAAATPTYINKTGSRVSLRSAPAVNGACGQADAGPLSESTIPIDGRAEVMEACWCCAPAGEACIPGNKSGNGQAFLVQCFK